MPDGSHFPICYSLRDVPENLEHLEDVELSLKWESILEKDARGQEKNDGIEELNELFRQKAERILNEKGATCARVRHEKITLSRNYAHDSIVVLGHYELELFGKQA